MSYRRIFWVVASSAACLLGCASTDHEAPRVALPGVTDPVDQREVGQGVRDLSPPRVRILMPADGARLRSGEVPVEVEVLADDISRVQINGLPAIPDSKTGRYRAVIVLPDGIHTISATAVDQDGNEGRHGIMVSIDSSPPNLKAKSEIVVSGRVDQVDTRVTVNGKPVEVKPDLSWQTTIALNGEEKVTVVATDSFGNRTVREIDTGQ